MRRELFGREMDPRSPERGQYAFVQALIREVAYNTLSKKDRKKLHLAAARHLESLGSDELAGALASHYLAAHANAAEGEEADALAGQARIALRVAITRAKDLGSFGQAIGFLDQAVKVTADPAEQADLIDQSAVAARTLADLDDAERRFRRAMELASAAGNKTIATRATVGLAQTLVQAFRTAEAGALLEAASEDVSSIDERELIEFKLQLARVRDALGQTDLVPQLLEEVLAVAERRDFPDLVARGLMNKGGMMWDLGRRREAYALAHGARRLAAEHGLTDVLLQTMSGISGGDIEFDVAVALDGFREMMALARRTGRRRSFITAVGSLGYAGFLGGVWDEALSEMEAVLADELSGSDRMQVLNNVVIIRVNRGESVDAELAEIESLAKGMTGRWQGFLADPLANVRMAGGDYGRAAAEYLTVAEANPGQESEYWYRAALARLMAGDVDAARELQARHADSGGYGRITDARHATLAAGIAAAEGRAVEALPLYREALRNWRAAHAVWDEAVTGMDMALLLDPSEPEVAGVIDSTREILTRLGAKPYLEQLDRAQSSAGPATRPALAAPTEVGSATT